MTLIWIYLFNPDRGLAVKVTDLFGIHPIDFLNSPGFALPAVILTTIWWTVGFNLVLFLAGLQDIDPHLYEAAALDGASRWASFVNITVPGLRRVSMLVLVTQVVASFQVFGQVYIMTRGGPGDSSLVLIQNVYQTGIRDRSSATPPPSRSCCWRSSWWSRWSSSAFFERRRTLTATNRTRGGARPGPGVLAEAPHPAAPPPSTSS